ncbi:MAG: tetratricopeptide repeat protein [Nitrospirae bacterium]|nr:tetratricopeptide repeat protein [Nitrospirota bacterium]
MGPDPAAAQGTEADVFTAQAILAYEEKKYDEALGYLREALQLDHNNVEALYYIGLIYLAQRDPAAAVLAFERAYALNHTFPSLQLHFGSAYFQLEQYDKAEPLLEEAFSTDPGQDNLGYYVGFLRYRHKDYLGAMRAFAQATSSDPSIQQLTHFYAGLATASVGFLGEAAKELEESSRIRTVSPITGPADRLRDIFSASKTRERRLHGELRLGVFYDTNIVVNPSPNSDAVVIELRKRQTRSPGEMIAGRLDYAWLRTGPWEATVNYTLYKTLNWEIPQFNVENHMIGLGTSYKGLTDNKLPYQLGVQYSFDNLTLGGSRFLDRHSLMFFATLVEDEHNLTSLQTRYQRKDFSALFPFAGGDDRDAANWMAGVTHIFRFSSDKHFIRVGWQFDRDDAIGSNFAYFGNRGLLGLQYTLPWKGIRLKYDYDYYNRFYGTPHTIFPVETPDTIKQVVNEQNHVYRIEVPLPHEFTLAFDFQHTLSKANLPQIFNYTRQVGTVSLAWAF